VRLILLYFCFLVASNFPNFRVLANSALGVVGRNGKVLLSLMLDFLVREPLQVDNEK
jgi:hypothetical protein